MSSVAAIILSGGKGLRVGGTIPKQYVEVGGQPLLCYSLASFEQSRADAIFIVAGEDYIPFVQNEIVGFYGFRKVAAVVKGGNERYESVLNGLRAVKESGQEFDYVMIHDGARPFISPKGVNKMIDAVANNGAAVAAVKVKDTIKLTDGEDFVTETTQRSLTWKVQTPQCFKFDEILAAYENMIAPLLENNPSALGKFTDDESVYALGSAENKVKLIDIGEENEKITTAEDLAWAQWKIMSGRKTVLDQEVL